MNTRCIQQLKALQTVGEKFPMEAARLIAKRAQEIAPVRTGYLRDHIEAKEGQVVSEADYSQFVEFGTVHMEAQPFLRPAVDEHEAEIEREAAKAINAEIKEAIK